MVCSIFSYFGTPVRVKIKEGRCHSIFNYLHTGKRGWHSEASSPFSFFSFFGLLSIKSSFVYTPFHLLHVPCLFLQVTFMS